MADLDGDETEGDKSMSKPRSLDGVVTTALGKTDFLPDASFVTTQWLTLFMIPIVPLASFRVIKSRRYPEHTRICERTPLNAKQIGLVYLFIVFCAGWLLFVPLLLLIPAEYSVVFGHSKCLARAGAARCAPTLYFANINR